MTTAPRSTRELQRHSSDVPTDPGGLPVLWQLKVSNYNEKARWALDYKRVTHIRRAVVPGRHRAVAKKLTGGRTFPVLVLDGRAVGDSSAIIAALEERHPEPALYPTDPTERRRALALEDFFDEELGPHARLLFFHHALPDAALTLGAFVPDLRGARYALARASFPLVRHRVRSDFNINADSVALAYEKLAAAGARFRSEVHGSGYLAGEGFSVADLTLASLIAPLVAPTQFPYPQPQREHRLIAPLREALAREGLLDWTRDMYSRHRGRSSEVTRSTAGAA
ncbi:MAG: glutathione S-transferase [Solirubrobacterales bacterium]|nr:glutathione S-transferase [Solirubrobacterales bacterium]